MSIFTALNCCFTHLTMLIEIWRFSFSSIYTGSSQRSSETYPWYGIIFPWFLLLWPPNRWSELRVSYSKVGGMVAWSGEWYVAVMAVKPPLLYLLSPRFPELILVPTGEVSILTENWIISLQFFLECLLFLWNVYTSLRRHAGWCEEEAALRGVWPPLRTSWSLVETLVGGGRFYYPSTLQRPQRKLEVFVSISKRFSSKIVFWVFKILRNSSIYIGLMFSYRFQYKITLMGGITLALFLHPAYVLNLSSWKVTHMKIM